MPVLIVLPIPLRFSSGLKLIYYNKKKILLKKRSEYIFLFLEIFLGEADLRRGPLGVGRGIFFEKFYHKILLGGGGKGSGAREFGEKFGLQSGLFYKNWGAIGVKGRGNIFELGGNWRANKRKCGLQLAIFHGNNFQ
jgi:hypothetical protein